MRKIVPIILFAVLVMAVSLLLTLLIVRSYTQDPEKHRELRFETETSGIAERQTVTADYPNAYILSSENQKIRFLFNHEETTLEGYLADEYQGIADIHAENGRVTKVRIKKHSLYGVLNAYSGETADLDECGSFSFEKGFAVYDKTGEAVVQSGLESLVVGISRVRAVLSENKVAALLVEEETKADHIRVLLKNKDGIHFEHLTAVSQGVLTMTGDGVINTAEAGESLDVGNFMEERQLGKMKLSSGENAILLTDSQGTIGCPYPGVLYFLRDENGMIIINEVIMEEYVKRVLPSEMPSSFPLEAQKAQAVCARTYGYSHLKNSGYPEYGAHVDDSVDYQVYNKEAVSGNSQSAVEETRGEVLYCGENLVCCYYFSTGAGITETTEIWKNNDQTPMQNPEYIQRVTTMEEPKDLSDEAVFADFIDRTPKSWEEDSPYYRWNCTLNFHVTEDPEYGRMKDILVRERSPSGYIRKLEVLGEKGNRVLEEENSIRKYLVAYVQSIQLNDGSSRNPAAMLPSACFRIVKNEDGRCTLRGGGYGHGVGMSQYGAAKLAGMGMDYAGILGAYYRNVHLVHAKEE